MPIQITPEREHPYKSKIILILTVHEKGVPLYYSYIWPIIAALLTDFLT